MSKWNSICLLYFCKLNQRKKGLSESWKFALQELVFIYFQTRFMLNALTWFHRLFWRVLMFNDWKFILFVWRAVKEMMKIDYHQISSDCNAKILQFWKTCFHSHFLEESFQFSWKILVVRENIITINLRWKHPVQLNCLQNMLIVWK